MNARDYGRHSKSLITSPHPSHRLRNFVSFLVLPMVGAKQLLYNKAHHIRID